MNAPYRPLRRLLRLWHVHAWLDLLWVTRDLQTVLTYYGSDVILNLATIAATLLLAQRFDGIGAWSKAQILFMLGYAILVTELPDMLFSYNIMVISRRIGRGQFDHTLLQPQPVWMALLTEGFAPFSDSTSILPAVILLLLAAHHLPLPLTPLWLLAFLLNLVASAAIVLAYSFLWGSLAFWTPRAAEEISTYALELIGHLKGFPLGGAGALLLSSLLSIVPAGFVAWYPCRALLGIDRSATGLLLTPLAALLLGALTITVFRKGMQQYGRTGSQRYLSLGHRR